MNIGSVKWDLSPVSFNMFGYIPETKYLYDIIAYKSHNERFFEAKDPIIFGVPNN